MTTLIYRCVLSLYYQLFYYLEDSCKLDPNSEIDLYCLHAVYVKKINDSLRSFQEGWNNHAITTERCMTPVQLFTYGTLESGNSLDLGTNLEEKARCNFGPHSVLVPPTECPLLPWQEDRLKHVIQEYQHVDDDYSIKMYEAVRSFVYHQLT